MEYTQAIRFLSNLRLFGAKLGLENTRRLASLAGNPQDRLRFIHVAGTNGKGSVCAMLEAIYRAGGRRVGLFTSPHLVAFGERIQINRRPIAQAEVTCLIESLLPLLRSFPSGQHPTFFEVVTVMALQYFASNQCDLVVWETGLGGRLDATNIVTPLASVVTQVGLDHQQWLGNSLDLIAREKAGILKPRIPAVTAAQGIAARVLQEVASRLKAPLRLVVETDLQAPPLDTVRLPLAGDHQRWNAAVAVAVVEQLQPLLPVDPATMRTGLESTVWPGRLQAIRRPSGQILLVDGAHNQDGCRVLGRYLEQHHKEGKPALILGMLGDKDWPAMCQILAPRAQRICLVPVASQRASSPFDLATACRRANPLAEVAEFPHLRAALHATGLDPLVVIAGSIYLAGEALELLGLLPAQAASERPLNDWIAPVLDPVMAAELTDKNCPHPWEKG